MRCGSSKSNQAGEASALLVRALLFLGLADLPIRANRLGGFDPDCRPRRFVNAAKQETASWTHFVTSIRSCRPGTLLSVCRCALTNPHLPSSPASTV
jgi:hypothetical protein